jgi:hypothetical protein
MMSLGSASSVRDFRRSLVGLWIAIAWFILVCSSAASAAGVNLVGGDERVYLVDSRRAAMAPSSLVVPWRLDCLGLETDQQALHLHATEEKPSPLLVKKVVVFDWRVPGRDEQLLLVRSVTA